MVENKRRLKIFLCHASIDKPKVRELYRYLKKRGFQPWLDEVDLVGGQDWQVEIPKALKTSDAIIICLTKNSIDTEGYIQKEVKFALDKALEIPEGQIFLIPIKFEECEVPFSLTRYQCVDLTINTGYSKMMKSLKFRASHLSRALTEVSDTSELENSLGLVAVDSPKQAVDNQVGDNETLQLQLESAVDIISEEIPNEVIEVHSPRKRWSIFLRLIVFFIPIVLAILFFVIYSFGNKTQEIPLASLTVVNTISEAITPKSTVTPKSIVKTPSATANAFKSTKVSSTDGALMFFIPLSGDVDSFWVDQTAVTSSMFEKFINETNYLTDAEKNDIGNVLVYLGEASATQFPGQTYGAVEWKLMSGVDWKNPPVDNVYSKEYSDLALQVSWNDAKAYCQWAGKDLLSLAEWEVARRNSDVVFYNNWYGLGEWGDDKTGSIYRVVFGYQDIRYISQTVFSEQGFVEYRSANILTFRCKESE